MQEEGFTGFERVREARSLSHAVAARIRQEIFNGTLAPGERLPTEQALVRAFGVSRTVVREAVAALRAEGWVQTRQGVGAFVSTQTASRPFRIPPDAMVDLPALEQVLELRAGVEVEAAGLAATRHEPDDAERIRAAAEAVEAAMNRGDAGSEEDAVFHRAVAEATHNPHYVELVRYLGDMLIPRQRVGVWRDVLPDEEVDTRLQQAAAEVRRVADAVLAGDARGARGAMRTHVFNGITRYRQFHERTRHR